jgi:DNA-binding GntR family transcriptional regulator
VIDPDGPVNLFVQVADDLAGQIERGELPPGRRIPSESDIARLYGVGRSSAKRAVKLLKERGLVYGVAGKGVFVSELAE